MDILVPELARHLFTDLEAHVYALLDGASVPDLLIKLHAHQPEHVCLYRGDLKPDLAECAPYLVRLEEEDDFTNWVLGEGWGKHWGIFAVSPADLKALRKHFRTFLMVRNPEGRQVYFRYYDPRVLRVYLPTCNPEETGVIFGPVSSYICEGEKAETVIDFRLEEGLAHRKATTLFA